MTEIIALETLHSGFCRLMRAQIKLPNGGTAIREIEDHGRAVGVLPYDPVRGMAMLVRQFRPPVFYKTGEAELLEIVAGLVDDEKPEDAVRREALEESGLRLSMLEHVGNNWSSPGLSTERSDFYLACYDAADIAGAGGGVAHEDEFITPVEMSLSELATMADEGRLTDMKTFAMVQTLRLRHPELFGR